ncbi:hypothetical protein C8A03DRAFT_36904 [Achaetomium macrosporum]|uniref:GAF domain-containing protein n=1 Tax=Achaetomium macrosporum TaxID=79813 RepID=A0AAN7C4H6_9PEZI|nr:hypothetical protein C8A03DRAFT_36904 [Achaetomium macrosporum]
MTAYSTTVDETVTTTVRADAEPTVSVVEGRKRLAAGPHIVAEAVRATRLNLSEDQLDQLWLCGTAVPRATSICEHVLAGLASSLTIPGNDTGDAPSDLPVSVVLNLDEDARFCDVQDTAKRFYIGVPIRSPAGINIGVYCVFDNKPGQYVYSDEIQFIRDLSPSPS